MRQQLILFFVFVAYELWSLHDYNGLAAVVGGLTNSAVDHQGKLKASWQPEAIEAFAPLKELVGWKQSGYLTELR